MAQNNNTYNLPRRQVIERGHELRPEAVVRHDHIYAVSRRDPDTRDLIWGLVIFPKTECEYIETFNVVRRNDWGAGLITTDNLHFYEPTPMELQFAKLHNQNAANVHNILVLSARLKIYTENRWHKVASFLDNFFSC